MDLKITIDKIMLRSVVTAEKETTLCQCAALISRERIGCLIITDGGAPAGILTERDFVLLIAKGKVDPHKITAAEFMTSPLISISPDITFEQAVRIFNEKQIKRLPVVQADRVVGLLSLRNMMEFSRQVMMDLEKKRRQLQSESETDGLTAVYNKKTITGFIEKEYERVSRYGGYSTLLFIDIDHFKKVNDTWSHSAGDVVLKELCRVIRNNSRQMDILGRFGGEEFVIISPNFKSHHAKSYAERIRKIVAEYSFFYREASIPITISIGMADIFSGDSYMAAIEKADKALYHAKNSGRNCTAFWQNDGPVVVSESPGFFEG